MLPRKFYLRDTREVARELLGKLLVRSINGNRLSGIIVETEAYRGFDDTACHAHKGPTPRCKVMFGEGGFTYVYMTYGIHHMLNFVTEGAGFPAAVLIRAIEPTEGVDCMFSNRGIKKKEQLTSGPGKVTKALGIDRSLNAVDITRKEVIWVEESMSNDKFPIVKTKRIGIDYADPKARNWKWRYLIDGNGYVSNRTKN